MRVLSFVWLLLVLVLGTAAPSSFAQDVVVLYYDRPPYYVDRPGVPGGFLMDMAANVFKEAGLRPRYEVLPPKRILERIRNGGAICSVGWFKRPERERFARFTMPIYRNRPMVLLHERAGSDRFADVSTLNELFARRELVWGALDGFSYGEYVDTLRAEMKPSTVAVSVTQGRLLGMLAAGRFDYVLAAPEELDALSMAGALPRGDLSLPEDVEREEHHKALAWRRGDFIVHHLSDMPEGNQRHIMCSRDVPQGLIDRMNQAIQATLGP